MGSTDAELKQTFRKKMQQASDPLEKLRYACLSRGVNGIKGLGRTFRIYDDDGSKNLSMDEFKKGLHDYGVDGLTDDHIQQLFTQFDADSSGTLDFNEFLVGLQPPMNNSRLAIVKKAFEKADKTGDGVFTVADLKGVYKANKHPKYMSGEWTEAEVLRKFLDQFDSTDKDGQITLEEFIKYYANVSASIDHDAYFDLMMRNAWGL